MPIVGEASINILARTDDFEPQLRAETAGGFAGLESDAGASGLAAGTGLRDGVKDGISGLEGDLGAAGSTAGAGLKTGITDGVSGLEGDLAGVGSAAGVGLSDGVKGGLGGLEGDLSAAGANAGAGLRTGVKDGAAGLESDLAGVGATAGAGLRTGVKDGVGDVASDLKGVGTDAADALGAGLSTGGSAAGQELRKGVKGGLDDTASDAGKAGTTIASGLTSTLGPALNNIGKFGALGLAGLVAGAAKLGVDFQTSTSQLAAAADIPIKKANQIGSAFLNSGNTVIFSASDQVKSLTGVAAQLQAVQGHVLSVSQDVTFMHNAMDLAEESGGSLSSTTKDLSSVMQAFQIPLGKTASTATDLFNASRITGTSIDSLTSTMERLKARLGAAAPTVSDLSSLVVDLGEHGVTGSRGLMVVNTAINTLLTSTSSLSTAQAKSASTYATKLAAAQDAVKKASDGLTLTQQKQAITAQQAAAASVLGSQSTANAATASAAAVTKAQSAVDAQQFKIQNDSEAASAAMAALIAKGGTLAQQQALQGSQAAKAAADQQKLSLLEQAASAAQGKAATAASDAQVKGSVASLGAQAKQLSTSTTLTAAQIKLSSAEANLANLQKTGATITNANVKALSDLGIKAYDAQGSFVGMGSIIGQLQPKLKGLTEEQQLSALTSVFGKTASKALLDTVLAGPAAYEKAQKAVTDSAAAHHALAVQQQTLGHTFDAIKVEVIDLTTRFGTDLLPVMKDVAKAVGGFLGFLADHKGVLIALAAIIGVVLVGAIGMWVAGLASGAAAAVSAIAPTTALGARAANLALTLGSLSGKQKEVTSSTRSQAESQSQTSQVMSEAAGILKEVAQALQQYSSGLPEASSGTSELTGSVDAFDTSASGLAANLDEAGAALPKFTGGLADVSPAASESAAAVRELSGSLDTIEGPAMAATGATDALTDSLLTHSLAPAAQATSAAIEELSGNLGPLSAAASEVVPPVDALATSLDGVGPSAAALADGLGSLGPAAGEAAPSLDALGGSLDGIGPSAAVADASIAGLSTTVEALGPVAEASGEEAGIGFDSMLGPIALLIPVIMLLASHWKEVWGIIKDVALDVWHFLDDDVLHPLATAFDFVKSHLTEFAAGFALLTGPIGIFIAAGVELVTHWRAVLSFFEGLPREIIGFFEALPGFFEKLPGEIVGYFEKIPHEIESLFGDAGSWLLSAGKDIVHGLFLGFEYLTPEGLILKFHTQILNGLSDAATWLLHAGEDIIGGLVKGLEYITPLYWILKYKSQILSGLADAGEWLLHIGEDLVGGLVKGVEMLTPLYWILKYRSDILGFFKDAGTWLLHVGESLIEGLIKGAVEAPIKGLESIGKKVLGGFKSIFHIFSPSKDTEPIGKGLVDGLSKGLSETDVDTTALTKIFNKVLPAFQKLAADLSKALKLATGGGTPDFGATQAVTAMTKALATGEAAVTTFGKDVTGGIIEPLVKGETVVASFTHNVTDGFMQLSKSGAEVEGSLAKLPSVLAAVVDYLQKVEQSVKGWASSVATPITSVFDVISKGARLLDPELIGLEGGVTKDSAALVKLASDLTTANDRLDKTTLAVRTLDTGLEVIPITTSTIAANVVELANIIDTRFGNVVDVIVNVQGNFDNLQTDSTSQLNSIGQAVSVLDDTAKTRFGNLIQVVTDVRSSFSDLASVVRDEVDAITANLVDQVGRSSDALDTEARSLGNVTSAVGQLVGGLDNLGPSISSANNGLGQLNSQLQNMFTGQALYNEAYNAGGDIAAGLDAGLNANQTNVIRTAQNVAGGALSAMRTLLGISSPSTVFAELGGHIVDGLVVGITSAQSSVNVTMTQTATSMWTTFATVALTAQSAANTKVMAQFKADAVANQATMDAQYRQAATAAQAASNAVQAILTGPLQGTDLAAPNGLATQIAAGSTAAMQQAQDMIKSGQIAVEAMQPLQELIDEEATKLGQESNLAGMSISQGLSAGITTGAPAAAATSQAFWDKFAASAKAYAAAHPVDLSSGLGAGTVSSAALAQQKTAAANAVAAANAAISAELQRLTPDLKGPGGIVSQILSGSINNEDGHAFDGIAQEAIPALTDLMNVVQTKMEAEGALTGTKVVDGLTQGLTQNAAAAAAAEATANSVIASMNATLGVSSPSTRAIQSGLFVVKGLESGITTGLNSADLTSAVQAFWTKFSATVQAYQAAHPITIAPPTVDPALVQQQTAAQNALVAAQRAISTQVSADSTFNPDVTAAAQAIAAGNQAVIAQIQAQIQSGTGTGGGAPWLQSLIDDVAREGKAQAVLAGNQVVAGLEQGMTQSAADSNASNAAGQAFLNQLNTSLGVSSPSTKTRTAGMFLMQGLAEGITSGAPGVLGAMRQTADSLSKVPFSLGMPTSTAPNTLKNQLDVAVQQGATPPAAGGQGDMNVTVNVQPGAVVIPVTGSIDPNSEENVKEGVLEGFTALGNEIRAGINPMRVRSG